MCSLLCCFTRCSYVLDTGIRFTHQEFKTQARCSFGMMLRLPPSVRLHRWAAASRLMLLVRITAPCAASADGG